MNQLSRQCLAEFVGTFALVFAGTGAIVVNDVSGGVITHVGVALTFGLVVAAMIYALGDVSGAHLNPAVTLALVAAGRFQRGRVLSYLAAQLAGAFAASLLLRGMFDHGTLGTTMPAGEAWRSAVLEFVLTLLLMFVILAVSTREKSVIAGAAIGALVGLEALFAGPICGASMNPARSIAPAVVSTHVEHLWIYIAAPVTGALAAVPLSGFIHGKASKT